MVRYIAQFLGTLWTDELPAVVSKRGIDDGNQKSGCFLRPIKESFIYQILTLNFSCAKNKSINRLGKI